MSLGWSSYVAHKSPKGGSKTQIGRIWSPNSLSTNRVRRWLTSLIEANALALRRTTTNFQLTNLQWEWQTNRQPQKQTSESNSLWNSVRREPVVACARETSSKLDVLWRVIERGTNTAHCVLRRRSVEWWWSKPWDVDWCRVDSCYYWCW